MTTSVQSPSTAAALPRSPLPAVAGVGALAASAGAVLLFGDAMAGSSTAAEAATALSGSAAEGSAVLAGLYLLLGTAVVGSLAARLGRAADTGATRLLPVLGSAYLLLITLFTAAPAATVAVGTLVLDGGVSPTGAEAALVLMNVLHPVATWVGAAFFVAVAIGARAVSRPLAVVSAGFAVGLLLPPLAWAVSYLAAAWIAGVGIWLSVRR